ncbi:hypothetical protein [Kaistia granuli]|uniref:hypothetical protein n=1 Tax=Kaistia granuli TaxID=363259 RepID=UPI003CCC0652
MRVVSVSPGRVDTEFVKGLDQEWRDRQAAQTPLGRVSAPEDVASLLPFAIGSVIPIDCGRPLG